MLKVYLNLKIRDKVLLAFGLITIIFFLTGIKEHFVTRFLTNKKEIIQNAVVTTNAISETKYLMRTDMFILEELSIAETSVDIEKWWERHQSFLDSIKNTSKKINYLIDTVKVYKQIQFLSKVNDIGHNIDSLYKANLKNNYDKIYGLRNDLNGLPAAIFGLGDQQFALESEKIELRNQIRNTKQLCINNFVTTLTLLDDAKTISDNILKQYDDDIAQTTQSTLRWMNTTAFIGLILTILMVIGTSTYISTMINKLKLTFLQLSKGELPKLLEIKTADEIGDMSLAVNNLIEGLNRTSQFALEIERDNYDSEFKPLSENDILGNSLFNMRNRLHNTKLETEKRKNEDNQRKWAADGISEFQEFLRQHTSDIQAFTQKIINKIIKYIDINQGAIFILDDSDKSTPVLKLSAAYAYDREKYFNKEILLGEGLVGTCAIDKNVVYVTDLPEDYIEIESGLGNSNPQNLLVVPLKSEDNVLGVIELASFTPIEKYQIDFVEKLTEHLASTLQSIKINEQTATLLEQSQFQAAEMSRQESEMRQNLEEMRATQEELSRREQEHLRINEELYTIKKELEEKEHKQDDIINQLRRENDLKLQSILEKENESRRILTNSADGVFVVNEYGFIDFFNISAQKLWNFEDSEVIDKHIQILFPRDFIEKFDKLVKRFKSKEVNDFSLLCGECSIIRKDDHRVDVFLSMIENIIDDKLKITGFVRDLTRQKNVENEKNKLMESIMAKEFEYNSRINELELIIQEHDIEIYSKDKEKILIEWDDTLKTSIEIIDHQHKRLVDLINSLYRSFKDGNANKSLKLYFKELIEYADYHFSFEEKTFLTIKYEYTHYHVSEHKLFVKKIYEYQKEFQAGKLEVSYNIMNFLRDWLINHIMVSDMKYVDVFKRNGIK